MKINLEAVTVQDCIDRYELKGEGVLLDNGKISGFMDERGTKAHRPYMDGDKK